LPASRRLRQVALNRPLILKSAAPPLLGLREAAIQKTEDGRLKTVILRREAPVIDCLLNGFHGPDGPCNDKAWAVMDESRWQVALVMTKQ
jgi:hypothetical protein